MFEGPFQPVILGSHELLSFGVGTIRQMIRASSFPNFPKLPFGERRSARPPWQQPFSRSTEGASTVTARALGQQERLQLRAQRALGQQEGQCSGADSVFVLQAALCRCSQPLAGFSARCLEDEQMLQAIREANPGCPFMYVVDTRPKLNAMANRAAGKGYENEDNYENIRFKFIGIENIHVMRSSLQKLLEVCEMKSPSMSDFLTGLENSGWLRHIKAVMDAGVFLAKAVREERASVLVHCSDGWDRTAQVCSLASLLLDPFYRTFKGFMVLIEKEWIAMGHKFSHRCGHLDGDPKEVSPVFTQFVECVWQLMQQFPCSFEFSERFLLEIHDHVYSCQFGNFLGTCHKEREELRIFEKTHSLWPFLLQRKQELRNPLYRGFTAYKELQPNTLPFSFQFWCGMYNRFDKGMHPKQCVLDQLLSCISQKVTLEDSASQLENRLPILDGPLPSKGCTSPEAGAAAAKAPTPPQDCAGGAAPVLSNGPSLGQQKHEESPAQPQDLGASREDGQAQHQG
uniref:Myotubularin related protein 8 n=1 Tax=Cyanistes caeruleus TaxID=156563 RepID=A0A8C0VHW0_CYACU